MDGADVAVTWVDGKTGTANAVDYFLSTQQARAQVYMLYCANCPFSQRWSRDPMKDQKRALYNQPTNVPSHNY